MLAPTYPAANGVRPWSAGAERLQPLSTQATTCAADAALCRVGQWLRDQGYRFVCPTPETQTRVNARRRNQHAHTLADVFGWSRPFQPELLPAAIIELLRTADALHEIDGVLRSRVRFSSVDTHLLMHSAFPTDDPAAVFLGPDTYRFVAFIQRCLQAPWPSAVRSLADVGCGSGAGALLAAQELDPRCLQRVIFSDINPLALQYAANNVALNSAALGGMEEVAYVSGPGLTQVGGDFDLIVSDPPYMVDTLRRSYCHGGDRWGVEVAVEILREALGRLAPGGRLLLYTGTPVVNGQDVFWLASLPLLTHAQVRFDYAEIDPDVFSEDLQRKEYEAVDRIAVTGLVAYRPGGER